jgi:hypothetical protein
MFDKWIKLFKQISLLLFFVKSPGDLLALIEVSLPVLGGGVFNMTRSVLLLSRGRYTELRHKKTF